MGRAFVRGVAHQALRPSMGGRVVRSRARGVASREPPRLASETTGTKPRTPRTRCARPAFGRAPPTSASASSGSSSSRGPGHRVSIVSIVSLRFAEPVRTQKTPAPSAPGTRGAICEACTVRARRAQRRSGTPLKASLRVRVGAAHGHLRELVLPTANAWFCFRRWSMLFLCSRSCSSASLSSAFTASSCASRSASAERSIPSGSFFATQAVRPAFGAPVFETPLTTHIAGNPARPATSSLGDTPRVASRRVARSRPRRPSSHPGGSRRLTASPRGFLRRALRIGRGRTARFRERSRGLLLPRRRIALGLPKTALRFRRLHPLLLARREAPGSLDVDRHRAQPRAREALTR